MGLYECNHFTTKCAMISFLFPFHRPHISGVLARKALRPQGTCSNLKKQSTALGISSGTAGLDYSLPGKGASSPAVRQDGLKACFRAVRKCVQRIAICSAADVVEIHPRALWPVSNLRCIPPVWERGPPLVRCKLHVMIALFPARASARCLGGSVGFVLLRSLTRA